MNKKLTKEQRLEITQQWSYHVNRCDKCEGYPILCCRGKYLHQLLYPEDWKNGKPTR